MALTVGRRRRPRRNFGQSLRSFLCGMALLPALAATTTTEFAVRAAEAEAIPPDTELPGSDDTKPAASSDPETNPGGNDEEDYDPHAAVLMWLQNRARYAEKRHFKEPWKNDNYGETPVDDDESLSHYQYQNGYYFSWLYLRLISGYEDDDGGEGETNHKEDGLLPRIVAERNIPKGTFLVGVPSNSFVYHRRKPTYKMLHPCDVASKLLSAQTYRYPENDQGDKRGYPSLENYVRPFLNSILSFYDQIKDDTDDGAENRRKWWSPDQLESLTSILGNELEPKANTLGLWSHGENTTTIDEDGSITTVPVDPVLCRYPNTQDRDSNRIIDHFYNTDGPKSAVYRKLFRHTVQAVVTRSWNLRMVPIYHWIPRSDTDSNVVHSEHTLDPYSFRPNYWNPEWNSADSLDAPRIYRLHAARDIAAGETIVLPYHSVGQQFATEGTVSRKTEENGDDSDDDDDHDRPYRFWTQTLHDQWGTDLMYGTQLAEPYNDYLTWDYHPRNRTVSWVHKSTDLSHIRVKDNGTPQVLRATQRNVLQAQYVRLRSLEEDVRALDATASGNRAIAEYYDLWVESLGVLLAQARPNRTLASTAGGAFDETKRGGGGEQCSAEDQTCASTDAAEDPATPAASTPAVAATAYDDLRERYNGDPVDYNRFVASHDCTNLFKQTTYEVSTTPYAELEWTRSYIGGGSIGDHDGDADAESVDDREQDTCLHLDNVLHSCLAFRPHVHETLIHYPASFLPKGGMKRVLYVGGGDLVLLHELLRYPSIELVLGLEIDQFVLRDSFRHYGIQPKFEDERVHWWFGDAAKSLTLLPPDEYFGTFDMVLIDLVVEIFDSLKVGEHKERLVDYMTKLLKPEGILVRQEDWPLHNVVDFAKYTVDLNLFGMPHTCSQYFTMASPTIDFSNHPRVDHELDGLVWYEPKIGSHDHIKMWGDYRNNLDPPERICPQPQQRAADDADEQAIPKKTVIDKASSPFYKPEPYIPVPTKGVFVAIEAEDLAMDLTDLPAVQSAVTKALTELGFSEIDRHDISVTEDKQSDSSMLFVFEEGYLTIRSFPEHKFASMDLQLWNDGAISKREAATSTLVGAIGGDWTSESTSTFLITTGGMLGTPGNEISNDRLIPPMVPSPWCDRRDARFFEERGTAEEEALAGLEIVLEEFLATFTDKGGSVILVLCPDGSSRCKAREGIDQSRPKTTVLSFEACPRIAGGTPSDLDACEAIMLGAITDGLASTEGDGEPPKISAVVIDPEAPFELGQLTKKVFVDNPSSYQWLSHEYMVMAPSAAGAATGASDYRESWRYQLLERFRTDLIEFHPVYHATVAFRDGAREWTLGVQSAGTPMFYGHLTDALDVLRPRPLFAEVILVETKTGAISHIPDYLPSKWATPSDYDVESARKQYAGQRAVGVQRLTQYVREFPLPDDIAVGDRVLFARTEENDFCGGYVKEIYEKEIEDQDFYLVVDDVGQEDFLDRPKLVKFDDTKEVPPLADKRNIPFGTIVLADGEENLNVKPFYAGLVLGRHRDGRYKVYFLNDGSFSFLKPNQLVEPEDSFATSAEEARVYDSCEDFYDSLKTGDENVGVAYRRAIGDGCLGLLSWPHDDGISTMLVTYDGQLHIDFNAYNPQEFYDEARSNERQALVDTIRKRRIDGMERMQTDFFPRGYGRIINFRHDLDQDYFGTKYPRQLETE